MEELICDVADSYSEGDEEDGAGAFRWGATGKMGGEARRGWEQGMGRN